MCSKSCDDYRTVAKLCDDFAEPYPVLPNYLPGKLFACLKSTDNLAAAIKKGGKRRRGQDEEEMGEYEVVK